MGVFRSSRRGPTQGELALRGLLLVGAFGLLLVVMTMSVGGAFADTASVTTKLDTAGGSIISGSDVKLDGLVVGSVKQVRGDEDGVVLDLELDNTLLDRIPRSVEARVLPATVFGTSFVDLNPRGGRSGPHLEAGDVIEQDTSTPTLELQKALDSIDRLVDALGPAELSTALHSLAGALDGRGAQIGRTLDLAHAYLTRLEPSMPLVREDIRLLASNVELVRRTAPDLLDAVDDALYVGGHLVEKRAQLTSLLSGGLGLVDDTDRFLTRNQAELVRVVRQAAVVTDAVHDQRSGLRTGLLSVADVTRKIQTIGEGQWFRVDGTVVDPKYPYYTRADCPRYQGRPGGNCPGGGR
jgi:phospholipid/cholesterol/gamma-HCH transport system substrate-binding protein